MNTVTTRITFDIPKPFHRIIKSLAALKGDTLKTFIIKALTEYIEEQKDLQDGLKALAKYEANPNDLIDLEDLVKEDDLEI